MSSSLTGPERLRRKIILYTQRDNDQLPWNLLKFITPDDFKKPAKQHPIWLLYLDSLRWEATRLAGRTVRVIITSDYREGDPKTHGTNPCVAADIRAKTSGDRYFLLWAAFNLGIKRIGLYCDDLHLHFDIGDLIYGGKWPTEVAWVRECDG